MVWLSTTGDVLNDAQQAAFEGYIRAGGGYVGVHAAADTEYDWPWYGQLVGAWFKSHPATQPATVNVIDRAHPSTKDVPATWTRTDEWYDYKRSPRADVHVLAELQERRPTAAGRWASDHPIAWCRAFDGGRTWYTGLGHTQESYAEPAFRSHLTGGILWAAGLAPGDCGVTPQPQPCEAADDEFDAALDCKWTIVRPNTAAYAVDGGALRITTENGDLWGGGGTAKNLILQQAPSGAWEITTKVTINSTGGSEQAALLVYADDDNYFKLGQIARDGQRWFEVVQEIGAVPRHDAALDRLTVDAAYPTTFYLRLSQTEGVGAGRGLDGRDDLGAGRPDRQRGRLRDAADRRQRGHERHRVRNHGGVRLRPRPQALRHRHDAAGGHRDTGRPAHFGRQVPELRDRDAGRDRPRQRHRHRRVRARRRPVPALHGADQGERHDPLPRDRQGGQHVRPRQHDRDDRDAPGLRPGRRRARLQAPL